MLEIEFPEYFSFRKSFGDYRQAVGSMHLFFILSCLFYSFSAAPFHCDVLVAGGSTSSLAAALTAAQLLPTKIICLTEPTGWLGIEKNNSQRKKKISKNEMKNARSRPKFLGSFVHFSSLFFFLFCFCFLEINIYFDF